MTWQEYMPSTLCISGLDEELKCENLDFLGAESKPGEVRVPSLYIVNWIWAIFEENIWIFEEGGNDDLM